MIIIYPMVKLACFKNIFFFLGFISVISCQSFTKKPKPSDLSVSQLQKMDQALIYIKARDFLKAVSIYDKLSKELKGKPVETMMLFNSGSSYRKLGDCDKSVTRYRRMLERSLRQPSLKVRGLMEISYSYACSGDLKASFLSLKDAERLRTYLPQEVNQIIHPARLSISYAWLGEKKLADQYKSAALAGVLYNKAQYKYEKEITKNFSRIFYQMGRSYMSKDELVGDSFVRAFSYHQTYLLQSLFLNDSQWSLKAKKEISLLFDKLYYALLSSNKKIKKEYVKIIKLDIKEGQKMIHMEKSLKLKLFYKKQLKKIRALLG